MKSGRKRALAGREDELMLAYRDGLSINELAIKFNASRDTVRLELEYINEREVVGIEDKIIGFSKAKEHKDFFYILGMIWGIGSFIGGKFVIRHKSNLIIDRIYNVLSLARIKEPYLIGGRLCIGTGYMHPLIKYLLDAGWIGRQSNNRSMPTCAIDEAAFVCGYTAVHHSLAWARNKSRPNGYARLRIYGPHAIMDFISTFLAAYTGVGKKNLHSHSGSDKMVTLDFSKPDEVAALCVFLGLAYPTPKLSSEGE